MTNLNGLRFRSVLYFFILVFHFISSFQFSGGLQQKAHNNKLSIHFQPYCHLPHKITERNAKLSMNIFGDFLGPPKLMSQKPYPEKLQLFPPLVNKEVCTYTLREKLFSFSGEDFQVYDQAGNEVFKVNGKNINLGGFVIDKLYFKTMDNEDICSVERRIVATTTCYDLYRDGKCIAKIEREMFSVTPKYKFFYEGDLNPFPDFTAEGSFSERKYTFKNGQRQIIAMVDRNFFEVFQDVDTYQVQVASGVDAAAIIAVAVVIDEDHDEKND